MPSMTAMLRAFKLSTLDRRDSGSTAGILMIVCPLSVYRVLSEVLLVSLLSVYRVLSEVLL